MATTNPAMLERPPNMPRRAWQRRRLRPNASSAHDPAGLTSQKQAPKRAGVALTQSRHPSTSAKRNSRKDSSSDSESETDSDGEYGRTSHSVARRSTRASATRRHNPPLGSSDETDASSNSDSDPESNSSYYSLKEDEDNNDKAEYYDELIERFRKEGLTLTNHGKNTRKIKEE